MRQENLLSPGLLQCGLRLRSQSALAISSVEIQDDLGNTGPKATLAAFFLDCADKCGGGASDTSALVSDGDTIATTDATGTPVFGGAASVTDGVLSVQLPGANAIVTSGVLAGVTVTGTYTSTVTLTVSGGAVTAIALS